MSYRPLSNRDVWRSASRSLQARWRTLVISTTAADDGAVPLAAQEDVMRTRHREDSGVLAATALLLMAFLIVVAAAVAPAGSIRGSAERTAMRDEVRRERTHGTGAVPASEPVLVQS